MTRRIIRCSPDLGGWETGCAGDANEDGVVNVDDLLVVINNWGECQVTVRCPGNVGPEQCDNFVNSDDLNTVINSWDPCADGAAATLPPEEVIWCLDMCAEDQDCLRECLTDLEINEPDI